MSNCTSCPALCSSRSQIVFPTPGPNNGLLVVGEAPGAEEDRVGEGFVGRAGKTLDQILASNGIGRHSYGRSNLVRCRPEGNRKPTRSEIAACLPQLAAFLEEMRPRVIITIGAMPTAAFLGAGALATTIEEANAREGWPTALPHQALQDVLARFPARIFPTVHTSPLSWNRNTPDGTKWSVIGQRQIALAVQKLNSGEA